jgi:hypothetical protein
MIGPSMSRRVVLLATAVLLLVFVAIQFVPVERANPRIDPSQTVEQQVSVPPDVKAILDRSCKDCHSNETRWPSYAYVAPTSWLLAHHVRRAREEVNFSEWGQYDPDSERDLLIEICRQVQRRTMPLGQYTLVHRAAKLSQTQIDAVCDWTRAVRKTLQIAR